MLSEYSDDLASLFTEGVEADYFRSQEEMIDKIDFYLRHDALRELIAQKGHERVVKGRHDVVSRMREFCGTVLT